MTKPLAFVVDDNQSLGDIFTQCLELCGFTATYINDSTEVLPRMIAQQPDLVILDVQMPKMNGVEVLHAIRSDEKTAKTKVIIVTASSFMLDQSVGEQADLVLEKPVSLNQIMQLAERMLKPTE